MIEWMTGDVAVNRVLFWGLVFSAFLSPVNFVLRLI